MQNYDHAHTANAQSMLAHMSLRNAEAEHRIANSLQLLSATLQVQARAVSDPVARSVLFDVQQRLIAMGSMHRLLQHRGSQERVMLHEFLEALVASLREAWIDVSRGADLRLTCADIAVPAEQAVSLAMIASELVCNALKYAYPDDVRGEIRLDVTLQSEVLVLSVEDDGTGIGHSSVASSDGTGKRIIQSLAKRIGATIEQDESYNGTRIVVRTAIA